MGNVIDDDKTLRLHIHAQQHPPPLHPLATTRPCLLHHPPSPTRRAEREQRETECRERNQDRTRRKRNHKHNHKSKVQRPSNGTCRPGSPRRATHRTPRALKRSTASPRTSSR